eukprot:CAMPEP_0194714458 /NCGR_PEP_ID=MMETSP0296-20130528/6052_1 /TAXON_ID=39354 /ORGANISM="Heterosigma akashiwo, Strain CCMP2393" /LENGTH=123 /DNA_ID=CAMNT_0039613579 /DNA_START=123 /DNA_END=491 /DNA_ORIENTATION=+
MALCGELPITFSMGGASPRLPILFLSHPGPTKGVHVSCAVRAFNYGRSQHPPHTPHKVPAFHQNEQTHSAPPGQYIIMHCGQKGRAAFNILQIAAIRILQLNGIMVLLLLSYHNTKPFNAYLW